MRNYIERNIDKFYTLIKGSPENYCKACCFIINPNKIIPYLYGVISTTNNLPNLILESIIEVDISKIDNFPESYDKNDPDELTCDIRYDFYNYDAIQNVSLNYIEICMDPGNKENVKESLVNRICSKILQLQSKYSDYIFFTANENLVFTLPKIIKYDKMMFPDLGDAGIQYFPVQPFDELGLKNQDIVIAKIVGVLFNGKGFDIIIKTFKNLDYYIIPEDSDIRKFKDLKDVMNEYFKRTEVKPKKYKILCVEGKTNSGKSTLVKNICSHFGLTEIVSYTTREMREDDIADVSHHFITREKSDEILSKEKYLALWDNNQGTKYFTTFEQLPKERCVYIINPSSTEQMVNRIIELGLENQYEVMGIFMDVPTDVLEERARKRKDDLDKFYKRLQGEYDEFNVNNLPFKTTNDNINKVWKGWIIHPGSEGFSDSLIETISDFLDN